MFSIALLPTTGSLYPEQCCPHTSPIWFQSTGIFSSQTHAQPMCELIRINVREGKKEYRRCIQYPWSYLPFKYTVRVDGDTERNTGAGEEFFVCICHGKSYSFSLANTMPIMPEMLDLVLQVTCALNQSPYYPRDQLHALVFSMALSPLNSHYCRCPVSLSLIAVSGLPTRPRPQHCPAPLIWRLLLLENCLPPTSGSWRETLKSN